MYCRKRTTIALLLFVVMPLWSAENLLSNGGFETGEKRPDGWSFAVWSSKPSRGAFEWSTDARSGKRAAKLVGRENAGKESVRELIYSHPIDVGTGLFKLRGWYRTRGDARAQIQVRMHDQDFRIAKFSKRAKRTVNHNLPAASDWSQFDFDVDVGRGIKQIVLLLRSSDIGEVEYDDVSFTCSKDPLVLRLYPAEYGRGDTVRLLRDAPNFIHIALIGDRRSITTSAAVRLDLPEGIGDFGLLGGGAPLRRDGRPYRRFRVPVPAKMLGGLRPTISHCYLTVWLNGAKMPASDTMYYRPLVDGEALQEKQAKVEALPPLPDGPRPRQFHSFFCWGTFSAVPPKLYPAVYDMIRGMGIDRHLAVAKPDGWRKYLQDRLRADGGKLWANIPTSVTKAIQRGGGETAVIAKGKSFFAIGGDAYRRLLSKVDGAFWDWEPANAVRNPRWEDPATVAAFARKEGLEARTLTVARLKGELRERFLAFRTWQLGQVVRLWASYVHDLRPDLTIAISQGSGMPPDRHVDYKEYNDIPHLVHLPMIYTSSGMSFARNVAAMRTYVPNAALFPVTSSGMVVDKGWPASTSPRQIYFQFVVSALSGSIGCSHWPDLGRGFDMEYVWEVSRAMRDIACVEPFLFDGKRDPGQVVVTPLPENEARIKTAKGEVLVTSPQWDRFALCYAYRLKKRTLVSVCNMNTEKPATVRVRLGDAEGDGWSVYDPVTQVGLVPAKGKIWPASRLKQGILYEVAPASLGMLVIARDAPKRDFKGEIREADVRRRFEKRCAEATSKGGLASIGAGELEINWADMDGDGNAEIRMASKHQELGLGPSGNLWSWHVRGRAGDLVSHFDGGGACQDRFWWPEPARTSEDQHGAYELISREIKGGRATVTFRRALSHYTLGGLILEKSYSITENAPRFDVRITIRNESPEVHEFSYWSHNCFHVGATPTLMLTTQDGPMTFSGETQPREVWAVRSGLSAAQAPLISGRGKLRITKPTFVLGDPDEVHLFISTDPDSLLQVYRWWDGTGSGRYTMEWMYRKQSLATGKIWTTRFVVDARNPAGR